MALPLQSNRDTAKSICFAVDSSCDWRGEAGTNFIAVHREMEPPPVGTETPEFERKLQRDHHAESRHVM